MYCYAQLNEENICIGISQLSGKVAAENMIELASYDTGVLGKKYVDGKWKDVEQPTPQTEPTQLDKIQENQLALMEAVADQYEEHLQNRINDMEVQASIYEAVLALGGE